MSFSFIREIQLDESFIPFDPYDSFDLFDLFDLRGRCLP
jgi:hypothetical protein